MLLKVWLIKKFYKKLFQFRFFLANFRVGRAKLVEHLWQKEKHGGVTIYTNRDNFIVM